MSIRARDRVFREIDDIVGIKHESRVQLTFSRPCRLANYGNIFMLYNESLQRNNIFDRDIVYDQQNRIISRESLLAAETVVQVLITVLPQPIANPETGINCVRAMICPSRCADITEKLGHSDFGPMNIKTQFPKLELPAEGKFAFNARGADRGLGLRFKG